MRGRNLLLAGLAALIAAAAALLFAPIGEYSRSPSPDGVFVAVVRTQPIYSLIAVMPGQAGDKPGRMTLYRGSRSCGSAWIPMVSMAGELLWQPESKLRRAEVRLVATWNLNDCALESAYDAR